ncbi:MAG: Hsp70 family protein, partial [Deltaproteobacteria bacterium]|nr:Hsp70 family protein [Deltaproteobacteria bacterium]
MSGSIYGIDLGTTFTSIAVAGDDALGRVSVLKVGEDGEALESIVYLREEGGRVRAWVGARARDEHKAFEAQGRYVTMAKRFIGIDTTETAGWPVAIGGFALRPHHVSSLVLRKVAHEVTRLRPHDPVSRVVVTHPHYFPDAMKEATRDAGTLAGLEVVDTLNEPSAAVLAYGVLQRDAPGRYLVFDLGGGTFDVTLVEIGEARIRVVAGGGDPRLGGFDWDQRLLDHFNTEFRKVHPAFDLWARASEQTVHEWREAAVRMKHQLSVSDVARARLIADVDGEPAKTAIEVTRAAFEGMTSTLCERALALCEEVLARASVGWTELRDVLLVGGSTRMPLVRERVARALGRMPRIEGFDPA